MFMSAGWRVASFGTVTEPSSGTRGDVLERLRLRTLSFFAHLVTIGSPMVSEGENHRAPVPPTLTFARVPEGKTVKNRLHLDVNPTDREQDDEVRRLLDLGARHSDVGQGDVSWVVLADPEGNEFCVLADRRP
jgi:Glyoxalase-like domain